MTPPHTPRPDCPQESVITDESSSTQVFGVMYITVTGLIDSMVPTSRPWAVLGKLLSYIVNLAPILWWALPAGPAGRLPASSQETPTGWIPDTLARLSPHTLGQVSLDNFSTAAKLASPGIALSLPSPPQALSQLHALP
ncbi:hypothetical protein DSO57_1013754 [Entomophthora muscae]|uniref:Uncharacterized protein n=1 Tax=Entomophthora muscae TaxID=34485 RepID=A0ACC2RKJ8_9FUNG|nr:hypothetical protein DSO57_1013754 [Entomophthora muscae]